MKSSLFAAGLVLVAGTVTAHGAILQWDALFNGNASTANNWNPNQRPTAADDLRFDSVLNNNYTVTYDALVPTVRSHQYLGDNVTIRTTFPHSITNTMSIENGSEILLDASALHVGGSTTIGAISGLGGRLTIDQSLFTSQQLHLGAIGPGNVIVGNAGRLEVSTVTLRRGSSLALQDSAIAELSSLRIGEVSDPNASSVLVTDGADMTLLGGITMSPVTGASSLLRVLGGTANFDAHVLLQGDLLIAANTTAAAAGNATLLIESTTGTPTLATVTCDALVVGDSQGGQGNLAFVGGTLTCSSARFVGGHSTLAMDRGVLRCTGPFAWESGPLTIDGSAGTTVELRGTADLSTEVFVGTDGFGDLRVTNDDGEAAVATLSGNLILGDRTTGQGTAFVGDGDELRVAGRLRAGGAGNANVTVNGLATIDELEIAALTAGVGQLNVGGGTVNTLAGLYVGGTATTAGGIAQLNLIGNSVVNAQGAVRIWNRARVDVGIGQLLSAAPIQTRPGAEIVMNGGTITAPSLAFQGNTTGDGVDFTGSGTIDAAISSSGVGNNIDATGPLTMGRSDTFEGYGGGNIALSVGPHTVTLRGATAPKIGDTTIAAGTLVATNALLLQTGRTLSGGGTIDTPFISNLGIINATTPQGFVIKGIVVGEGTLTGTLFDFSNTGGFTGSGTINSQIRGTAGSVISAFDSLTLGTASSVGFSFDGTIRTNAHQVTLRDSSTAFVGNIELEGGSLFCTDTDLASDVNDVTSGFGTIATTPRTWINAGTIRPSGSGADTTGQISTLGNVNMENVFNTAVIDLDIGGTSNANMDRFVVVGALTIDGTLRVRFVPGYVPAGGELYTVITANSITGNFTTLDLPPRTRVIVNPTSVQVEALCPSDQNANGTVDGDDVIDLFAAWDLGLIEADTNGDGSVDGDDVIEFFEHWDAGC